MVLFNTKDDGFLQLYSLVTSITYSHLNQEFRDRLHKCDGYNGNNRQSAMFTTNESQVSTPFCVHWKYNPPRYIYERMPALLRRLMGQVQQYTDVPLSRATVNMYGQGDFISRHKDYYDPEQEPSPIAVICSFEEIPGAIHLMDFYRTIKGHRTTKKDKHCPHSFSVPLKNHSVAVMMGMQQRYAHSVQPGTPRISVIFR